MFTKDHEINGCRQVRPHVFVLGAGASRAACPKGDANGNTLPIMSDLVSLLGLEKTIPKIFLDEQMDFEKVYSEIYSRKEFNSVAEEIEDKVHNYFQQLRLPDYPTVYDYLVAGLREKDYIATFNWDPLLFQALQRSCTEQQKRFQKSSLPKAIFLHGNVAVGYCDKAKCIGPIGSWCSHSGRKYKKVKLLYPVAKKNYTKDPFIQQMWGELEHAFEGAAVLSLFGYSAPVSDVEAIDRFKKYWGPSNERMFEEIEIINTEKG
jgi:hypothetical protein